MSSTHSNPASPPVHSSLSPVDLRHMASTAALASPPRTATKRSSQHRLGSRSPISIPSSPTSVHSSSSAIFERDIEPLSPSSPPHSTNPHRIPRAKATEQLEHAVPSVLDSAASVLASLDKNDEGVAVVAPVGFDVFGSGFASPIGSLRSRSPSPRRQGGEALLSIPETLEGGSVSPHMVSSSGVSPGSPRSRTASLQPASPATSHRGRSIAPMTGHSALGLHHTDTSPTPTSAYFSTTSSTADPDSSPPAISASFSNSTTQSSHPPSPHTPAKRLSFISYADLLSSTPASLQPLSSLTTSASTYDPPPHIPSVAGSIVGSGSSAPSIRGGVTHPGMHDSILMLDDIGGEWEREGLGRGLEERLQAVLYAAPRA